MRERASYRLCAMEAGDIFPAAILPFITPHRLVLLRRATSRSCLRSPSTRSHPWGVLVTFPGIPPKNVSINHFSCALQSLAIALFVLLLSWFGRSFKSLPLQCARRAHENSGLIRDTTPRILFGCFGWSDSTPSRLPAELPTNFPFVILFNNPPPPRSPPVSSSRLELPTDPPFVPSLSCCFPGSGDLSRACPHSARGGRTRARV